MKKNEKIAIYDHRIPKDIEAFMEALDLLKMHFTSTSLENIYHSDQELEAAIGRAMRICSNIGLPLEQHFRKRYLSDSRQHTLETDWKMSKVAYCLTLVNGDPDNPVVGRMQWELINRMM